MMETINIPCGYDKHEMTTFLLQMIKTVYKSFILTGNDVTEFIYVNVTMWWQVPIHRGPVVSLRPNI